MRARIGHEIPDERKRKEDEREEVPESPDPDRGASEAVYFSDVAPKRERLPDRLAATALAVRSSAGATEIVIAPTTNKSCRLCRCNIRARYVAPARPRRPGT